MLGAFSFESGGRTYSCAPEQRPGVEGTWWWFTASNDAYRYAPFEVAAGDTQKSVQERIIAYHEHHLWVRQQPAPPRYQAGRPGRPPADAAKPAPKP